MILNPLFKKKEDANPPFLKAVRQTFGRDRAEFVRECFNYWRLPIPNEDAYVRARDKGMIIPLTPFGALIRLTAEKNRRSSGHGFMLQPIGHEQSGRMHLSIVPGLKRRGGEDKGTDENMLRVLHEEGYKAVDCYNFNAGFLPRVGGNEDGDVIVYFDPDCFHSDHGRSADIRQIAELEGVKLKSDFILELQHKIFGNLMDAYKKMRQGRLTPQQFWERCAEQKSEGVLISEWDSIGYGNAQSNDLQEWKRGKISDASYFYGLQLKQDFTPAEAEKGWLTAMLDKAADMLSAAAPDDVYEEEDMLDYASDMSTQPSGSSPYQLR